MSEKMLTANEFLNREVTVTVKTKFVTWEGSQDGTPQVLDEKPGKHLEVEMAVRRLMAKSKGKNFSCREVCLAVNSTNHIVKNVLEKLYRHDLLKKIHEPKIRYIVL